MNEEFGSDYITIEDEDGNEYELEHLDTIDFEGRSYVVCLPADMDEDDEDYGYIFLRSSVEEDEQTLMSIDDEDEENRIYEYYMALVFAEDDDE